MGFRLITLVYVLLPLFHATSGGVTFFVGLVRSSLPLHIPLTGVPVILKSAQRIEESPRFAFRRNAMVKEGGAIITDSSDSCGIFRMTVATFLRNLQNDGGNIPAESE